MGTHSGTEGETKADSHSGCNLIFCGPGEEQLKRVNLLNPKYCSLSIKLTVPPLTLLLLTMFGNNS